MDETAKLKKQIILYGALTAMACQLLSLLVLGWKLPFLLGLLGGLATAILNFFIMAACLKQMLQSGSPALSSMSFFARMLLYCVAFILSIKLGGQAGLIAGAGCLVGVLSTKLPMFYLYAVKSKFDVTRQVSPETKAAYEEEDQKKEDAFWNGEDWDEPK